MMIYELQLHRHHDIQNEERRLSHPLVATITNHTGSINLTNGASYLLVQDELMGEPWARIPRTERRWVVYDAVRQLQPSANARTVQSYIKEHHQKEIVLGWISVCLEHLAWHKFLHSPDSKNDETNRAEVCYFTTDRQRPVKQPKQ